MKYFIYSKHRLTDLSTRYTLKKSKNGKLTSCFRTILLCSFKQKKIEAKRSVVLFLTMMDSLQNNKLKN